MRVKITAYLDEEEDGVQSIMTLERESVDTIEQLAHFYEMAAVAMGFSYVSNVGLTIGENETVWSSF
jgi:hypothetical protein